MFDEEKKSINNDDFIVRMSVEEENAALMAVVPEDDEQLFIADWALGIRQGEGDEEIQPSGLSKKDRQTMHTRDPYEF
jgi:hypothetical protein